MGSTGGTWDSVPCWASELFSPSTVGGGAYPSGKGGGGGAGGSCTNAQNHNVY